MISVWEKKLRRSTRRGNVRQKNKCGRGQPPRPHCSWIPALPCHRMAADDRLSPTALSLFRTTSAAFAKASCPFMILRQPILRSKDLAITNLQLLRLASGPVPLPAPKSQKRDWGRRPQRPGNQSRSRAFSGGPPAIHPRESPAAAGSAAIIRQAQELSRFAEPTLIHFVAPRNTKNFHPCAETVDDRTSLWKPEEN